MPLYDYDCAACGRRFEVIHGVHEDGPTGCPLCGKGPIHKAFAPPAIHFKGSGWAKKERRSAARKGSPDKSDSSDSGETVDKVGSSDKADKTGVGEPAGAGTSASEAGQAKAKGTGSKPAAPAASSD